MSDSSTKTYVYDNTEVKLTGRTAEKKTEGRSRRGKEASVKIDTMYEVTPAGVGVASWKQWVRMTDLYEINE